MFFKITACLESLFSLYLTHFKYMSYIFFKWSFSKFKAAKFWKIVVLFSSFLVDVVLELPSKFCSRSEVPIIFFGKQIFCIRPKSLKTHLNVPFKVFYYFLLLSGVSLSQTMPWTAWHVLPWLSSPYLACSNLLCYYIPTHLLGLSSSVSSRWPLLVLFFFILHIGL